jgi:hypothetical protein
MLNIGDTKISKGYFNYYFLNNTGIGYSYKKFMRYSNILEPTKEKIILYENVNNGKLKTGYTYLDKMDIDITKSMIQGALYFHPGIRGNSIEFLKIVKTKQPKIYEEAIRDYPFAEPNMTLKKLESLINAK